jgi:hypothetical protein
MRHEDQLRAVENHSWMGQWLLGCEPAATCSSLVCRTTIASFEATSTTDEWQLGALELTEFSERVILDHERVRAAIQSCEVSFTNSKSAGFGKFLTEFSSRGAAGCDGV